MLIDSHSHLNFKAYKEDLGEVIKRTQAQGVLVINVGSNYETSKIAVDLAQKYNNMYAAIGLHPIHTTTEFVKIKEDPEEGSILGEVFNKEEYKKLINKKVVAIGEIGLDYYYRPKTNKKIEEFKNRQKEVFIKQLEMAKELNLPVIIHCRMAHKDMIDILRQYSGIKGVMHCFTGTLAEMEEYINMGLYIGLNGIIFKLNLDEVVKEAPLEKILIETDCPYLTPPQEGNERNEPVFVKYVAEKIAQIKETSFEEVAKITTQNAKNLFGI